MRTYSEDEIEEYVENCLGSMPWKNGVPPPTKNNSARFILLHVLKSQKITLSDNNEIYNSRGYLIGYFGEAKWIEENVIEWSYVQHGGSNYIISKLRVGP